MIFLMNKNNIVASFEKKPPTAFSDESLFTETERIGKLPLGFNDINTWIDERKPSKHNIHLRIILRHIGYIDNDCFIRSTHAKKINDTFWIKADSEILTWKQISLYSIIHILLDYVMAPWYNKKDYTTKKGGTAYVLFLCIQ